ncbi:MAG: TrkH family potassium uptake protein [Methanosarcinales archaeon]|nr:TrkH family potassium uptake protein [Methanosarcinales archaeon]
MGRLAVNFNTVFNVVGSLLRFLAVLMFIPVGVAYYYNEPLSPFLIATAITGISGILINMGTHKAGEYKVRESFAIVAFGWLAVAIFGALPYVFNGVSPIDAFFESMSGFTTTGSTIFTDIEAHTKSLLFWRSFTQWLGGMGIIVLFIAILPKLAVAGRQLFKAEVPGPTSDKLRPRLRETAKILWAVYLFLTYVEIMLLYLSGRFLDIPQMSLYDAVTTSFSTLATGGFSPQAESIAAYNSPVVEGIIIVFMFLAGANFALHYRTIYGDRKALFKDKEFQVYSGITLFAVLFIAFELWLRLGEGLFESFMHSAFQVVAVMTTTGFATTDFNVWPESTRFVLFLLIFIGGCAGSTGGGMKVVRVAMLIKYSFHEMFRMLHPKAVKKLRFGQMPVSDDVMKSIISFFILYMLIFLVSSMLMLLTGLDIISATSSVATALSNVGPGFALVGPMQNFSFIHPAGKVLLALLMWVGRLEVFTVLVLLMPEFWKK